MDPQVSARFSFAPKLSQILPVTFGLLSGVLFIIACFFSWHDKNYIVPLMGSLLFAGIATVQWWRSHKDTDLRDAPVTDISLSNGTHLTTDARTLESQTALDGLAKIFDILANRQPLPSPDGLIDDDGNKIENSSRQAIERVNKINSDLQDQIDEIERFAYKAPDNAESSIVNPPIDKDIYAHTKINED